MKIQFFEEPQPYPAILDIQRNLFNRMVSDKKSLGKVEEEYLFLLQHTPVITLGRHAKSQNLLYTQDYLESIGVDVHFIERGGDVTYHGPGQLVVYPLIDLESHHLGVKDYVELLEKAVIVTLNDYGIQGEVVDGAPGVWIGKGTPYERKICALGVKCSRYVSMHGLALNVNTDLKGFNLINPCGFVDKGVTSMAAELGTDLNINEVAKKLADSFLSLLNQKEK